MKERLLPAISAVLLLILIQCAAPGTQPLTPLAPDQLMRRIESHTSKIRSFKGQARLSMVTDDGPMQGSLTVVAVPPDSLWLKVEGPLGVDVAVAHLADGLLVLYSPWEDRVYRGSVRRMQELRLIPQFTGGSNLIEAVMGVPKPEAYIADLVTSMRTEGSQYIMGLETGEELRIEDAGPVISKWEKKDESGTLIWKWEALQFRETGGVRYPRLIRMTAYDPPQRVTIYYERVRLNQSLDSDWYALNIPEGVMRIDL